MTICLFSFLFGVINVFDYFLCLYNFIEALLSCNSRKVRKPDRNISYF